LHRIPSRKKPVLLMHGIFASDFVWTAGPTNSSLAYILADQGYDVWLGNSRGNTYSRKHSTLNPEEEEYWSFSWDELGKYDIPAIVDYILEKNGEKKTIVRRLFFRLCYIFYRRKSRTKHKR